MRKRSYGSVDVFWLDRDEAVRRVETAAGELIRDREDVEEVYLFGSLAEGRAVPGSDADVLLVLSESEERWADRPAAYQEAFRGVGMPVELFCYTREEMGRTRSPAAHARRAAVLREPHRASRSAHLKQGCSR